MASLPQLLLAEHAVFAALFDEIDAILDQAQSPGEVNRLARLVESALRRHGDAESELAYAALDQMLAERGELLQLHQDHREIDAHLARATIAPGLHEARRLLRRALAISRVHFRREERSVFPLFEKAFNPEALEAFGDAALQRYLDADREPHCTPAGLSRSSG